MKWDKAGAIQALEVGKCVVCEQVKPIKVVVTHHGIRDLHLPCCSDECMEVVSDIVLEGYAKMMKGKR